MSLVWFFVFAIVTALPALLSENDDQGTVVLYEQTEYDKCSLVNRSAVFTDVGSAWEHNTWAAIDGGTFNSKAYLEGTARSIEQYVDLHLSYAPATGSARDKFMQSGE